MTDGWEVIGVMAVLGGGMISILALTLHLFKKQRAGRNLEPPEKLVLWREPGESLWTRMDELWEESVNVLYFGACAVVALAFLPMLLARLLPWANGLILIGCGFLLLAAGAIKLVRRLLRLLDRRADVRLGYFGERWVAEHLQRSLGAGYRIYHDVPKGPAGKFGNIDHVVVGPKGAVVIETKTRSKPTDQKKGAVVVSYDGRRICWPRWPRDTETLDQVNRNAAWLHDFLLRTCGLSVPVAQVVAIPGWKVHEEKLVGPRVVSGRGVGDAVMQAVSTAGNGCLLSRTELQAIEDALAELCRDVTP